MTTHIRAVVTPHLSGLPAGTTVLLEDDAGHGFPLADAFGTLLPVAVELDAGRPVSVWIEPPPSDWRLAGLVPPSDGIGLRFAFRNGELVRVK